MTLAELKQTVLGMKPIQTINYLLQLIARIDMAPMRIQSAALVMCWTLHSICFSQVPNGFELSAVDLQKAEPVVQGADGEVHYRDPRTLRFYEQELSLSSSELAPLSQLRTAKRQNGPLQLGTASPKQEVLASKNHIEPIQPRVSTPGNYWWQPLVRSRQRPTNGSLSVSLNSLLVGALSNSARVQVLADEPLINETEITTADAAFDWTSYLDARWDDLSEPVGSTLTTGGPNRLEDHNVTVEMGMRRRNTIGGEVEIGQRFGHQNNNSVFFVPNNQGTSRLTMSYTQPLLRGAGSVYNTSLTVLAKLQTDASRDEFERQLQDHLLDVTRSYWNLYFERGKLLQQTKLLRSGIEILDELESRKEIDALQSQIVRARAAVENRRAALVRARLAIKMSEARIRALVNDPGLGDTLTIELVPAEDLSELPVHVDLRTALSIAMQNRAEIRAALTQIKSACVRMNMSKRETLPILDLVLETYLSGLEGNSSVGRAFEEQFTQGSPSYGVGIQYEYPIWNRAASSRLQKRRLELRRLQHQFRSTMETLKLEVEVSVHELNSAFEALDAKRKAMDAAHEEVEYLKDRWQLLPVDNGSASLLLEDLLDAQDRLSDSEQSLLQSTLEYSLAQVGYKRSIGALLSQNQISLDRSCECNLPAQHAFQLGPPERHVPQQQLQFSPAPMESTNARFPGVLSEERGFHGGTEFGSNIGKADVQVRQSSNIDHFQASEFALPPQPPAELSAVDSNPFAPLSATELHPHRFTPSTLPPALNNRFE